MSSNLVKISALLIFTSTLTTGCIIHVGSDGHGGHNNGDVSSVFGRLEVGKGKQVGDVSSVNGGVTILDHVSAEEVDSVNGNIEIGSNVSVDSVETVNGSIETGHNFIAQGSISAVNGNISILADSTIDGDISTVNGDIKLNKVTVGADINTHNGSIYLTNNSVVSGNIVYEARDTNSWGWARDNDKTPTLKIDESSNVQGKIILNRKVRLEIKSSALREKVELRYLDK
ncbi:MAG: hypothetical protein ACI88A_001225 [Paraglaciecola sp.]|jgi:hypothetical protein